MNESPIAVQIKRALLGIMAQAQRDGAVDLVVGPLADGGTVYRYLGRSSPPTPWLDWRVVVSELAGLAGIRAAGFPKAGVIYVAYSGLRLRWELKMNRHDEDCVLHNLASDPE
jgi:hypothetical protein